MVNAKFNTDEQLNEILRVDRHLDHHPGRFWLAEDDGWYDDSDEENDMDEENDSDEENGSDGSEESWDDPNRRVKIPDKDGTVDKEENDDDENGSDDDNGLVAEEE